MNPYTNKPSTYLIDLLIDLQEYMDRRSDVATELNEDGSYIPNREMTFSIDIEEWIEYLTKQNDNTPTKPDA